jgi:hypothetical protein
MLALAVSGVIQVVVGAGHTCALHDDGTVSCWGANLSGQLGDGTLDDHTTPVPVHGLTDAVWLGADRDRTCARRRGGELVCWGETDGTPQTSPVALGSDVEQVSGPCVRTRDLHASCEGHRHKPIDVKGVVDAADISAHERTGCVVHRTGAVSCWFSPDSPEPVPGVTGAVAVTVGGSTACSRDRAGAVWCWQWGLGFGHLSGRMANMTIAPPMLQLPVKPRRVVAAGATELVGGFDRVCALSQGEARCWNDELKPVALPVAGKLSALAIGMHSCAVRSGHDVVCWGSDAHGELGDGWAVDHPTPLLVPGVRDAVAIQTSYSPGVGGDQWSCAVRRAGRPLCWGNTNASDSNRVYVTPAPLAGAGKRIARGMVIRLIDAKWLDATDACTITLAGKVRCQYQPVKEWPDHEAPGITDAVQIADGYSVDCARERSGQIACWKQAGIQRVPAIDDAIDLSASVAACAVRADHSVWCWAGYMQNHIALAQADGTPVKIAGLPEIARVSLGGNFACALAVDGTVWCWGDNSDGELGDGSRKTRDTPARVPGLEHVAEISAGTAHVCARLEDGQVACWGSAYNGQIGTRSGDHSDKPVAVAW